jgi:hypothetical protein
MLLSLINSPVDWEALATIVALSGVVASFVLTLRGQKLERENAENTASRAEAAARLTEGYTARVVDALEAMARQGIGGAPMAPSAVRWSLSHQAGDTYIVENVGTAAATSLAVSADDTLPLLATGPQPDRLDPGEALSFMAAPSLATSDFTITVSWITEGEDAPREWRYPLPFPSRR